MPKKVAVTVRLCRTVVSGGILREITLAVRRGVDRTGPRPSVINSSPIAAAHGALWFAEGDSGGVGGGSTALRAANKAWFPRPPVSRAARPTADPAQEPRDRTRPVAPLVVR